MFFSADQYLVDPVKAYIIIKPLIDNSDQGPCMISENEIFDGLKAEKRYLMSIGICYLTEIGPKRYTAEKDRD